MACGACWEAAIRDDERAAVEHGLPRYAPPNPTFLDEIAVERACAGGPVALTGAERAEVARRLHRAGILPTRIADLLAVSHATVVTTRTTAPPAGASPAAVA